MKLSNNKIRLDEFVDLGCFEISTLSGKIDVVELPVGGT